MELLTNSRLTAFRRCRRLHYYDFEVRRRPRKMAEALGFGRIFHAGLEQWWLAYRDLRECADAALEWGLEAMAGEYGAVASSAELNPFDLVKARELLRGYDHRWAAAMADLEVLDVEREFLMPLINPDTGQPSRLFKVSGKLDARVRLRSLNRVMVVEHKTSTADVSSGSDYWKRLLMDSQVSTYLDGASSLPPAAPVGCLYDVAKRPGLRPLKATDSPKYTKGKGCKECGGSSGIPGSGCLVCEGEGWKEAPRLRAGQRLHDESPDEYGLRVREHIAQDPNGYFQRGQVVRLQDDLDEHRYDTWETAHELRQRQLAAKKLGIKAWPRNPGACERYGRLCSYWDVCTGVADIHDDVRFRTADKPHEELSITGLDDPRTPKEGDQ
jgi:hypothetical protein